MPIYEDHDAHEALRRRALQLVARAESEGIALHALAMLQGISAAVIDDLVGCGLVEVEQIATSGTVVGWATITNAGGVAARKYGE